MREIIKRMPDLFRRLFVSIVSVFLVVLLVAFSTKVWVTALLVMVVALLAGIGVWEYAKLAKAKGLKVSSGLMVGVGALQVVSFALSLELFEGSLSYLFVLFLGLVSFFLVHFKDPSNGLADVAAAFFGVCYIAVPLSFMLGVLYLASYTTSPQFLHQDGRYWLFYLIFVTKVTDIGGYFVGKLWGKHPLAPVLSPNKTIEGAVAGFLCSVCASLFAYYISVRVASPYFSLSFVQALWLGVLFGILGQIGDLAESLLKRDAEVKDSNRLPGLGGVLDMVDSLLFTTPLLYFFLRNQ